MIKFSNEQGEGRLSNILFILLAIAGIYFALKFIPVKIDAYSFKDSMAEEASFASQHSDDVIHANLVRRAKELELPIKPEQIKVTREGQITVEAKYTVQVETVFFTYDWHFNPKVSRVVY